EISDDLEILAETLLVAHRSERDLCRAERLPGVCRIPFELEALDLDAQQLQLRDVALLGPEALNAFQFVQRREVLLRERERLPRDQDVGERLLHLKDGLPLEVGELEACDPRCGPS